MLWGSTVAAVTDASRTGRPVKFHVFLYEYYFNEDWQFSQWGEP